MSQATEVRRYLVHPKLDLWLVAGISIVFWVLYTGGDLLDDFYPEVSRPLEIVTGWFFGAFIIINYPHFMASYRLAYSRGIRFVFSRWFELVFVPLAMLIAFVYAYLRPEAMEVVIRSSITLMLLTVGWHYAKQFYGSVMVASNYEGYPLSPRQRNLLKYNFLSVWWYALVGGAKQPADPTQLFQQLRYVVEAPFYQELVFLCQGAVFLTTFAVIKFVFSDNAKQGRDVPGSVWVPWVTFFLWLLPVFLSNAFFLMVVPFFHSLQYLVFWFRVEREKSIQEGKWNWGKPIRVYSLFILAGMLGFVWVPEWLTHLRAEFSSGSDLWRAQFFSLAAIAFINIHHYFLDSVIWRFDNDFVRKNLLLSRSEARVDPALNPQ